MLRLSIFSLLAISSISADRQIRIPLERRSNPQVKGLLQKSTLSRKLGDNLPPENLFVNDYQYFGTIKVGTPGTPFNVSFNTAQNIVIIPDSSVKGTCGENHNTFNQTASSTFNTKNINTEIGRYNLVLIGSDNIEIAGVTAPNATVGLILEGNCTSDDFDGVLGLGFPTNDGWIPVVQQLYNENITNNVISIRLGRHFASSDGGEIIIGGWDDSKLQEGSLNYVQVQYKNLTTWQIPVEKVFIGMTEIGDNVTAIIDSSTALIGIPKGQFDTIKNATKATTSKDSLWVDPLQVKDMPTLLFTMNGVNYTLEGKDYVDMENNNNNLSMVLINFTEGNYVIGAAFLSNYYTVFNYDNRTVGFGTFKANSGSWNSPFWLLTSFMAILSTNGILNVFN